MRSKYYIVVVCLVSLAVLTGSDTKPVMMFEEDTYNFGDIISGDKVEHDFSFRNTSNDTLTILNIRTSCGCTAAQVGEKEIKQGDTGLIHVEFNSRGKRGHVTKSIRITTNQNSLKPYTLRIFANILPKKEVSNNHPVPAKDQNIFSPGCNACHSIPGKGKEGRKLYDAICAMCHGNGTHFLVEGAPALTSSNFTRHIEDKELYTMIEKGTNNPMMPGFGEEYGGPLTKKNIQSLVDYFSSIHDILPVDIPPRRPADFQPRMNKK